MATVISRLYSNAADAEAVASRLYWQGMPKYAISVFADGALGADVLSSRMMRLGVVEASASAYAAQVANGAAVVVANATYKPLGAARIAREVMGEGGPVDMGDAVEEVKVADAPDHAPSIMKSHMRMASLPNEVQDFGINRHWSGLLWDPIVPLVTKGRKARSATPGGGHWGGPVTKVIKGRTANSATRGGAYWSGIIGKPLTLILSGPRRNSVIRGGGPVFSRLLGWKTVQT